MAGSLERLERAPWLLPLVWTLGQGVPCDPVAVAEELGVPVRLAKTMVWTARRLGFCDEPPGVRVVRSGREFAAETPAFILYARLRARRVSGIALSKSGVSGGRQEKIMEKAKKLLEG